MKQAKTLIAIKASACTLVLSLFSVICWAQDNTSVNINGEPIGSWISRNWMWVAGGVVLLLLLIGLASGGSRTSRKTTIVREEDENGITRTTTTEIKE